MPVIKVYHHGVSGGMSGMNKNPPKRGKVGGWSEQSARRNTQFLQSVWEYGLPSDGYTFTLTVRDCPESAADWHRLRRAYLKRLERAGAICTHWVVEWQRRGVPHLHGMVYFPEPASIRESIDQQKVLKSWLDIAKQYGPSPLGQHFRPITDIVGWSEYLSKHAARGVTHYQRSPENVPEGWQRTGRMWGYTGTWPLVDADPHDVTNDQYWRYRRLHRAYEKAEARAKGDPAGIVRARQCLKNPKHNESARAGIGRFIPGWIATALIANAKSNSPESHDPSPPVQPGDSSEAA